jgi:hypothetical protein
VALVKVAAASTWIQSLTRAVSEIGYQSYELRVVFGDAVLANTTGDSIQVAEIDARHDWTYVNVDESGLLAIDSIAKPSCVGTFTGAIDFSDGRKFMDILSRSAQPEKPWVRVLNQALSTYQKSLGHPMSACKTQDIIDLGSVGAFERYRAKVLEGREHNSFQSASGWITKVSTDAGKLLRERDWFLNLPEDLRGFIPRVGMEPSDRHQDPSRASYKIQYFNGLPFSDYVLWSTRPGPAFDAWIDLIQSWLEASSAFKEPGPDQNLVAHLRDRFSSVMRFHANLKHFSPGQISLTSSAFEEVIRSLEATKALSIIHGDLVFSNTLVRPQDGVGKLIDPRGGFFEPSLFGDALYEWGKLAQSIFGRYDSILSGDFLHNGGEIVFKFDSIRHSSYRKLEDWFLSACPRPEISIRLGGILMLCAIPFHSERRDRQLALSQVGKQLAIGEVL